MIKVKGRIIIAAAKFSFILKIRAAGFTRQPRPYVAM